MPTGRFDNGRAAQYAEFRPLATRIAAGGYRVFLHDRRNTDASDISIEGKEVEEAVWAARQLGITPDYEKAGAIDGKRCGTSQNNSPKEIAKYSASCHA